MAKKKKSTRKIEGSAPVDASVAREVENKVEADALAKELKKGFYWRVALPGQPVVAVEKESEEDAIDLYNRWARINGSDHPYTTEKVPEKGPRVYETDDGKILYGASGKPGRVSWSPPSNAPNSPQPVESTN